MGTKSPKRQHLVQPRLSRAQVEQAVRQLGKHLQVPDGIWEGPLAKEVLDFSSVSKYRTDRLARDFLKKYPGFAWGNPREAAKAEFERCEAQNLETNVRLRAAFEKGQCPEWIMARMLRAASIISEWLGEFRWQDTLAHARFGPGVTSSAKGTRLQSAQKFDAKLEVSPAFAKTGMSLISYMPSWSCLQAGIDFPGWVTPLPTVVPGNRVTFVPKDASTDRTIAVEPNVNIFFQLGIGGVLRGILKKHGLDLDDQVPNQDLARLGSIDDSLSTIDLKSASNTLAYRLVMYLLPPSWFEALDRCRSQFGNYEGVVRPYQMFSSMGNGFTFELESMIFYALCLSVAQMNGYNPFWVRSYGDDIIVPSGLYDEVVELLAFAGFTVNHEKSYHKGPFRESCGKDYLRGRLVRPVYLKEIPDSPLAWIKITNNIKRLASVWGEGKSLDLRLKPAYDFAYSMIPRQFRRFSVPDGYGDVGILRDFDDARPSIAPNGWEGFVTNVIQANPGKYHHDGRSLITAGTHRPGQSGNRLSLRDAVELTTGTLVVASWRNLGPWEKLV